MNLMPNQREEYMTTAKASLKSFFLLGIYSYLSYTEWKKGKDVRSGNRTSDLLNKGRPLGDCAILASHTLLRSLVVIFDRGIRASGTDFDPNTYVDILRVKRPLSPLYFIS